MRNFFRRLGAVILLPLSQFLTIPHAVAEDLLTGDARMTCEALLCLSSGTHPSECTPALSRYFSIHKRTFSRTLSARLNFLNLCPASATNSQMRSLADVISQGAGRCDVQTLNRNLGRWRYTPTFGDQLVVDNRLPRYCSRYATHELTNFGGVLPRYVGEPLEGGYWVNEKDFERERKLYEEKLAKRKADRERQLLRGGD